MTVIEARAPDGHLIELTEVNLSKCGLLIMITDPDGNQVLVHRFAWDGMVKAIQDLFAEEKRQAQEWLREHEEEEQAHG
ncbi:MAG TPA: hypothetical protein VKR06_46050 [Ktedonosporobacter sp.]|nr:hypothetical protein [Ktedonosporobacter sp.]